MKPRKSRFQRTHGARECKASKSAHACNSGPWKGATLYLTGDSGASTGWLEFSGVRGRYIKGAWEPMQ